MDTLVDIVGAGVGKTILEAPENVPQERTISLEERYSTISDVTVKLSTAARSVCA